MRLEPGPQDANGEGQLLRYVFIGDTFVNVQLVREGAAAANPPDGSPHADELRQAQQQAQQDKNGLWARCGGPHQPPATPAAQG